MFKMKILNLYAGIGGNTHNIDRSKHDITHVEWNEEIAQANRELHPLDIVVEADAKKFLEMNYKEYDYIWASPPCPSHASIRKAGAKNGQYDALIPDMDLYGVIIFLDEYFEGNWTVENVKPFYNRLDEQEKERQEALVKIIPPAQESSRHLFWSNHEVPSISIKASSLNQANNSEMMEWLGIQLDQSFDTVEKRKILRNCVHPKIGKAILDACGTKQSTVEAFQK
jgi:DNA (cytosine-5)-methyltransferase 1